MGGYGSGREAHVYSGVVENCLTLDVNQLVKNGSIRHGCETGGVIGWENILRSSSIGFESQCYMENGYIRLQYMTSHLGKDDQVINYTIELMTTKPNYGGVRWWFVCPNEECSKMVVKLYQAPGTDHFVCRTCQNLTYESCRESHQSNPIHEAIAKDTGTDVKTVKNVLKGLGPKG